MLRRAAEALDKVTRARADTNMAPSKPPGLKGEYRDLYEARLAKKANSEIEPFLRLLYDNGLIDCGANPRASDLKTRIKIQKFVYFAQECFGLNFDYRHTMYIYGPYSPTLANDYFRIRDIKDVPPSRHGSWSGEEDFLEFAKKHDGVDWLEIASTLVYLQRRWKVPAGELVESAARIKYRVLPGQIKNIVSELQSAGFVK